MNLDFGEVGSQAIACSIIYVFSISLLPMMALVQGITITFMKAAYVLVYVRLTRGSTPQPALQMATP